MNKLCKIYIIIYIEFCDGVKNNSVFLKKHVLGNSLKWLAPIQIWFKNYSTYTEISLHIKDRDREGNPFISSNKSFVRFPGGFKRISSRADGGDAINRVDCGIQFWDWNRQCQVLFTSCDLFFKKIRNKIWVFSSLRKIDNIIYYFRNARTANIIIASNN